MAGSSSQDSNGGNRCSAPPLAFQFALQQHAVAKSKTRLGEATG
jgi:hypothetical protein